MYEIMWENAVEPHMTQTSIWPMRIACGITKATNTHSDYAIIFLSHHNSGYTNAP